MGRWSARVPSSYGCLLHDACYSTAAVGRDLVRSARGLRVAAMDLHLRMAIICRNRDKVRRPHTVAVLRRLI
jgi:hypothetical protein